MRRWQMQEAKARLSELIRDAEREGPQEVTVRGKPVAVVLSFRDYERLTGMRESLVAFLRRSPLYGAEEVRFERDKSPTREIEI